MKHGIIIIADKDLVLLKKIISFFDARFHVYVALDKKSKIRQEDLINLPNVKSVSKKYNVNWGGWNMVQYTLDLMHEIVKNGEIEYVHLISGSDYPIKNINKLYSFFSDNKKTDYLRYVKLPVQYKEFGGDGGFDRLRYCYLMDTINVRNRVGHYLVYGLVKLQKYLKIKRSFEKNGMDIYLGSQWWSLSIDTIKNVLLYVNDNPWIFKMFKKSYIPDETFFHTVIMNMPYPKTVENDNLRYFDWNIREDQNTRPAILNQSDLEILKSTNAFFARKFNSEASLTLIESLDHLNS